MRRCPLSDSSDFYPRPPRGGRPVALDSGAVPMTFLSTPSARRATQCLPRSALLGFYFYPRPPRGGRLCGLHNNIPRIIISIHALREEGDRTVGMYSANRPKFLSTPSARRATAMRVNHRCAAAISIHALREEGDLSGGAYTTHRLNFYPRPPRGGRQKNWQ